MLDGVRHHGLVGYLHLFWILGELDYDVDLCPDPCAYLTRYSKGRILHLHAYLCGSLTGSVVYWLLDVCVYIYIDTHRLYVTGR